MTAWLRTVPVPFAGEREGEGPATWGQDHFWYLTEWLAEGDPYFNVAWSLAVPGRADLDSVLRGLGRLVERHESLRTNWTDRVQRVSRTGTLAVDVHDALGARPLAAAQELAERMKARPFAYGEELPIRCAVVMDGERPAAVAFAFTHLALDAWSLDVIAREWRALVTGAPLAPPSGQPMDLAATERDSGRALAYWRAQLERVPMALFHGAPMEPEEPRYVRLVIESAAMAVAARNVARRCSVSETSVIGTACAVVMARHLGLETAVMQWLVANRHTEQSQTMVGTVVQDGLFVLDLPKRGSFAEVMKLGHRRALTAYRNGHYDTYAMRALREEMERARGGKIDLSAYFNDGRVVGGWPNAPRGAPEDLLDKTRSHFVGAWPEVDASVFFATGHATHTCQLYLLVDTARVTRETAFAMLRDVEALLVKEQI